MKWPFGRWRLASAALLATLAFAGVASAQLVQLPPNDQVNNDPALGIDPNQDAGVSDVVGGALDATKPAVPWGTFEQKVGSAQHIFVRAFKNGAWQTQGQSLNIQANQEAEAPSIDFAATGRTVPWTAWYEPNSDIPGGKTQIFASRFNAAGNTWIPEGQDRAPQNRVPSLNIHLDQDAENPAVAGGAAVPGNDPVPWVAWQETDGTAAKDQIFVSRGVKQSDCTGFTPSANASVGNFCWQQVGLKRVDASSLDFNANGDPSLNIDPKRDGIEPDFAFTGNADSVPWVVWYEKGTGTTGLRTNEQVFAAKAIRPDATAGAGGFHWQAVGNGTAGQVNVLNATGGCSSSQDAEDKCSLNLAPGHDAEDPRVAAGTQKPGGTTVPWVVWTEDNGSGIHQIFASKLVGDHFELLNDGQPLSTVVNDSTRADITFSGHTPYVSWIENVNGTLRTFVGHFEGNAFKLDDTAGAADADIRSPISSNCIATPFNADGDACQGGAAGTPYFLYLNGSTGVKRLLAKAYAPRDVVTGNASSVERSSATVAGSLNTSGAPTKVHVEFGTTTAYGAKTADQVVGPATTPHSFSAQLTGLPAGTTIHYRAVALNDTGTVVNGADQTLTTQGNPAGHKKPKLKLLGGKVLRIDRHGRVHLRIRSTAAITGKLALVHGHVRLGSATVSLKANKDKAITITLSRKARGLVRHARHHRLSALEQLRAHDAAGIAANASKRLTIRR